MPLALLTGCLDSEQEDTAQAGKSGYVAMGTSLTAGFQSGGMRSDWQMRSFPALIAQQMDVSTFELPVIDTPGISTRRGRTPLSVNLSTGLPASKALTRDPQTMLLNRTWNKPYNNLGIPGSTVLDVANAYSAVNSQSVGNSFFDIVLRPTLFNNTTMLRQAVLLQPNIITLEMGSNDILGGVTAGTIIPGVTVTPVAVYAALMDRILDTLLQQTQAQIFLGNLPAITSIPYVTTIPRFVFNLSTLTLVDPPTPYETVESNVRFVLLGAIDSIVAGGGLPGANRPLLPTFTLTDAEVAAADSVINAYNVYLKGKADASPRIHLVDLHDLLLQVAGDKVPGVSGKFYLFEKDKTAFSLDGIHPNNVGYRLMANAYLAEINKALGKSFPTLPIPN